MQTRDVQPEILDRLPAEAPEALRSRRDLRLINFLMGNHGWLVRAVLSKKMGNVTEIGAGDGGLCRRFAARGLKATGVDLVPRPAGLQPAISWVQGDLFTKLAKMREGALVGNMILHHFEAEGLAEMGRIARQFPVVCFCEPWRSGLSLLWGGLLIPLVGAVTRHDMPVSIRAGFRRGELARLLGLEGRKIRETVDWRGSVRLISWKQ